MTSKTIDIDGYLVFNKRRFKKSLVEKIIRQASQPGIDNIVIDGFSGIGGVTAGFGELPNWKVIACVNHWDIAIETHRKNHPDCLHLEEDFQVADLGILMYMVEEIRRRNPGVKLHLWLSLECTNFSLAKGGMSRDADSRTLADYADRYVIALNPDVVWIENVKEFTLWGPTIPKVVHVENRKNKKVVVPQNVDEVAYYDMLIQSGKVLSCPVHLVHPDKKGKRIRIPEYIDELEYLNMLIKPDKYLVCKLVNHKKPKHVKVMQYEQPGAYSWQIPCPYYKGQDFKRWKKEICELGYDVDFKLFNCADYGVPQHRVRLIMQFNRNGVPAKWPSKTHDKKGKNGLPKWIAVRGCLNLDDEGESVLSYKEQKGKIVPRIKSEATIVRLTNGCDKHVLNKRESNFFSQAYSGDVNSKTPGVNQPSRCITATGGNLYIAKAHTIDHIFGNGYHKGIDDTAGAVRTKDGHAINSIQFIVNYNHSSQTNDINEKSPAVVAADKLALGTAHFMDMQYSSGQQNKSIEEPAGGVTGVPKNHLVEVSHVIMDTQYNKECHGLEQPARTQTANRKHFYLVNFQWANGSFRELERPANTIIARMDKAPNYLVVLETGELAIEVYDYDPPHYVMLKKYMAENGIVSINMRPLNEVELLKIMSMDPETKMHSSSTHNKKMIGNAVPSLFVTQLGRGWDSSDIPSKQMVA